MRATLAAAAFLLAGPALAQPAPLFLHLESDKAEGVVEVNGAPATQFPTPGLPPGPIGPDSTAFPLLPWLDDGANKIVVRVRKVEPGGYVQAGLSPSPMQPPERPEKAEAAGEIALEAKAAGMPKWSWHAAEPWAGDAAGLKAAVAALHAKLAAGDVAALRAARAPMNADFDALYGPEPADEIERFDAALKRAKLQPLPPLEVKPIGEGRRVLVSGPGLAAPIHYLGEGDMAGFSVDAGTIWAKLGGQWKIVR